MGQYVRMVVPRGLGIATVAAIALVWALFVLNTRAWPGIIEPIVETVLLLANLVLTARSRQTKVRIVRLLQRWMINPLVRLLLNAGINPLGLALLETRGRVSGQPRRTPVGNGQAGTTFWIIAEHGTRAGYVRNIQHDPRVRVRLRVGRRYRWVPGLAQILPDDDALARQRSIARWHPLRTINALVVRILGTDLLTVRVQLLPTQPNGPTDQPTEHKHSTAPAEGLHASATPQPRPHGYTLPTAPRV